MVDINDVMREFALLLSQELEARERDYDELLAEVHEYLDVVTETALEQVPDDSEAHRSVATLSGQVNRGMTVMLDTLRERQIQDLNQRLARATQSFFEMLGRAERGSLTGSTGNISTGGKRPAE